MEISFIHTHILVHLHVNKTNFHRKGFALGLALKQRRKATRKSPISLGPPNSEMKGPKDPHFWNPGYISAVWALGSIFSHLYSQSLSKDSGSKPWKDNFSLVGKTQFPFIWTCRAAVGLISLCQNSRKPHSQIIGLPWKSLSKEKGRHQR